MVSSKGTPKSRCLKQNFPHFDSLKILNDYDALNFFSHCDVVDAFENASFFLEHRELISMSCITT